MRKTILIIILCHICALVLLGTDSTNYLSTLPDKGYSKDKIKKIKQLMSEGDSLYKAVEYDKAIGFYKAAENIINKSELEASFPKMPYDIAYTYFMIDSMSLSIKYFKDYLESDVDISLKRKGKIFNKIAEAHTNLGNIEYAYEYQIENRKVWEELKDTVRIGESLYQLGTIQFSLENYEDALKFYNEARELDKILKDSFSLYACLGAIGGTYNKLGETDKATQYNKEALDVALALNYDLGIAFAYFNIAADYYDKKSFEKSLGYAKESLEMMEGIDNGNWYLSPCYRLVGMNYMMLDKLDEAETYLGKATRKAEELSFKPQMVEAYEVSAEFAERTGNYKTKSAYLEKLLVTKDQIMNESIHRRIQDAKNNYEIYKQNKKIKDLKETSERQEKKSTTFAIIITFLLPFLLLLVYLQYVLRKGNKLLESKNELIERQNNDLELSNKALEDSNTELEQFAYVASHDMMEPIRTIRSFNSLLKKRYANILDERGNEFVYYVDDASKRLDIMLTDLLNYSRVNSKDKNRTIANLTETARSAAMNLTHKFQDKAVTLNIKSLPEVKVNAVQMERLFQNLIENGIKYNTQEQKTIDINYKKNGKAYIISVKDNGIGIEPQYKDKVFEIFRRLHGTSEYAGSGIGLATCKKIVEKHNGKIWLDSKPNKGTTIFFTIPFHKKEEVA